MDTNKNKLKKNILSTQVDLSKFTLATEDEKRQQDVMSESTTFFKDGMRRLRKNPLAVVSICVLVFIILAIIIAPMIVPYGYEEILSVNGKRDKGAKNLAPFEYSKAEQKFIDQGGERFPHIFGTDEQCRDYFIRVVYGTRVSLVVGVLSSILLAVCPDIIVRLIGINDPACLEGARTAVRLSALSFLAFSPAGLFNSYLVTIGKEMLAVVLTALVWFAGPLVALLVLLPIGPSSVSLGLSVGSVLALVGFWAVIIARKGRRVFPHLLVSDFDRRIKMFDLRLDAREIARTAQSVAETLKSAGADPSATMRASLMTEEVLMAVLDRNAGRKTVLAEVTLDLNDGVKLSKQKDMLPILGIVTDQLERGNLLMDVITSELGVSASDILDFDIYLYDHTPACTVGVHDEFISSGRLDDLSMVHAGLEALLATADATPATTNVLAIFDNEETGSQTKQGAGSPFLSSILQRIVLSQGGTQEDYYRAVEQAFMVSADNAHAWHPNYNEKYDPTNHPVLGGGPVVKFNAAQKYASDAVSAAVFSQICANAGVPCQRFVNHSDVAGGSTLGNILTASLPLRGVDMGNGVWSMHSIRETGSVVDQEYCIKAFTQFYWG